MLELDVTHMVRDADEMPLLSGSVAELGDRAGAITWENSMRYAAKHPLLHTAEDFVEARDYFREFGAWTAEQIEDWTVEELQGITVQEVASQIREMEHFGTYEAYQHAQEEGTVCGCLYRDSGDRWVVILSH